MKRRELIEAIDKLSQAIKRVEENWESGDLAGAVNNLCAVEKLYAQPALIWWNED